MIDAADRQPRGGFLFNVNVVFLSQILIYGFAFGLRVVLARGLGDTGLGTYSLFFVAVLVAGGVANLGVGLGNIYFLNKGAYAHRVLLSNSLFVLISTSLAGWALIGAYALAAGPDLFVSGRSYWMYAVALPAVVGYVLLTSFLHGSSRFPALAGVAIVQGSVALAAAAVLHLTDELTVFTALIAWAGSFVVADVIALLLVATRGVNLARVLWPDWRALRDQVSYGAQGQIANLAQLFNYRLDQFLVAAFVSRAGVGHYTVAVGLSESVWWISSSVAMVLLPRLTGMSRERAGRVTPVLCRNTLAVSIIAAIGLIAVSPFAVRVLFGDDFYPASVLPLVLLMPGIIAASATRVLASYLFSQGRIIYNTYATFIALGVTISLGFILIPLLEVEGAAIASSIAYACSFVATLHWYRKESGGSIAGALFIRGEDFEMYAAAAKRALGRKSGAEAA
jgi:O-antigen/teichoic acid export membrane protein